MKFNLGLTLRFFRNSVIQNRANSSINKKIIPTKIDESFVESDVEKLCKYVCINYLIDDLKPGPEILPDSEYPKWLFELDLRPKQRLEDLDPEKDKELYWQAYKERMDEEKKLFERLKYKYIYLQRSPSIKKNRIYNKFKYIK